MQSDILIAVLGSGVLSTLIAQFFSALEKRRDARSGQGAAMRLVLKDRLRFLCETYINQGWIYADELDDIIQMHKCYHDTLHGNGYLDELMRRVKSLEIRGVGK